MTRTVRRNSKEFKSAVAAATEIRAYSLDNGFTGKLVEAIPAYIRDDFKLTANGQGYCAHVHSNLWFTLKVAA